MWGNGEGAHVRPSGAREKEKGKEGMESVRVAYTARCGMNLSLVLSEQLAKTKLGLQLQLPT